MNKKFARIYPAVVTPFREDDSFDMEAAHRHADWMIDNGITGMGILMASGEYQSVTMDEHKAYVRELLPYLTKRTSVVVGCSKERPEDVVELMENAREAGADAAMVLPSFYYRMSQNELIEHYRYINDHSELPILVYNNPGCSSSIAPETLDELCQLERVAMIKETSGQIDVITDFVFRTPKHINIMCGCDYLLYQAYCVGACGWISMSANVLPKLASAFHKAMVEDKDYEKGLALYQKMWPVLNVMERFPKPTQAVKYLLKEVVGIDVGGVRRPRRPLSKAEKQYVLEATHLQELLSC